MSPSSAGRGRERMVLCSWWIVPGSSGSRLGSTSGCAGEWDWRLGTTSAGLLLGLALATGVGAAALVLLLI